MPTAAASAPHHSASADGRSGAAATSMEKDTAEEPQPGCSHWNMNSVPSAAAANSTPPAAGSAPPIADGAADTAAPVSGTASPQQRVSSSSMAPIDWEGLYNEMFVRNATLITRLQVGTVLKNLLGTEVNNSSTMQRQF